MTGQDFIHVGAPLARTLLCDQLGDGESGSHYQIPVIIWSCKVCHLHHSWRGVKVVWGSGLAMLKLLHISEREQQLQYELCH